MNNLKIKFNTDIWVKATWEEYLEAINAPACENARGYYHNGQLRIEMLPIGSAHSRDNSVVHFIVSLFATIKGIPLNGLINCSYRKVGVRECQPDISYYIGEKAQLAPQETSVIDLNRIPPPDLAIEISSTTLADDLGQKRLLYEQMDITEYWVVDVQNARVIAFAIADRGSWQINQSQVLPGLTMSFLEEALQHSRQVNQSQLGAWLLSSIPTLE